MHLDRIEINNYRSIENVVITMPLNKPLILFGPNNAGKSNILSAINRILGEKYPTYIEMLDSDYYQRDKSQYPTAEITVYFDSPIYSNRNGSYNCITLTYGYKGDNTNNLIHDGSGNKLFLSNEDRIKCQSYLIDAERNIQLAFNYSSKFSMLSKFSHKIHSALTTKNKKELTSAFDTIKSAFTQTQEFSSFSTKFTDSLKTSVKGFVHSLDVDFSAYDPNNYAKSMRIFAKEEDNIRGFEEFGTGEQQVLLMAFIKAYMEVFANEFFVLIIEEPEAHLHPLAQRWLKEYIVEMCNSGIQVIVSTHSADFIDASYLDGLVRVYKKNNITHTMQLDAEKFCEHCVNYGVPKDKANPENILNFYETKLFNDQLKGFFAENILLVEGETEYFSLPYYFKKAGFNLAEQGIEIVNCRGKNSIPLYYRLYSAYGYKCFCLFDCDMKKGQNTDFIKLFNITQLSEQNDTFVISEEYGYFGKDFETYMRNKNKTYQDDENKYRDEYGITSKPGIAKAIAQYSNDVPEFILKIKENLE